MVRVVDDLLLVLEPVPRGRPMRRDVGAGIAVVERERAAGDDKPALSAMAFISDTVTLSRVSADLFGLTMGKANVREGKISISSPIARALIGKSKGDTAEATTPKGPRSYEIVKVEWK
jgi:transcription elongation factor GreA